MPAERSNDDSRATFLRSVQECLTTEKKEAAMEAWHKQKRKPDASKVIVDASSIYFRLEHAFIAGIDPPCYFIAKAAAPLKRVPRKSRYKETTSPLGSCFSLSRASPRTFGIMSLQRFTCQISKGSMA
jgi:hypothetical protein